MYGIRINFKDGPRIIELPHPCEWRRGTPVFALAETDGGSSLLTAEDIRTNWNAWASEYFPVAEYPRLTIEEAKQKNIEIL
jgi:hypothetical protein